MSFDMSECDWLPHDENGEVMGPTEIFGYDGRVHPDRATPASWRRFWMRRARRLGTHSRDQWIDLRDRIGQCLGCGSKDRQLTKDHITPVSRGGCDCIQNIQPLCHSCNSKKGASV